MANDDGDEWADERFGDAGGASGDDERMEGRHVPDGDDEYEQFDLGLGESDDESDGSVEYDADQFFAESDESDESDVLEAEYGAEDLTLEEVFAKIERDGVDAVSIETREEIVQAHEESTLDVLGEVGAVHPSNLEVYRWYEVLEQYKAIEATPGTPKRPARELAVKTLEYEYEWMCISDRSKPGKYDLWTYDAETGWSNDGSSVIREVMSEELDGHATESECNHVEHLIANRHKVHSDELDAGNIDETLIPLEDGVLVLESLDLDDDGRIDPGTAEIKPHDPEHRFTYRLNAAWNPDSAKLERVDAFLENLTSDATGERDEDLIWEWFGHTLTPEYEPKGFFILHGNGNNGKSLLFELLIQVLGEENTSGTPLSKIVDNRFSSSRVVDRMANIAPDIAGTIISDISDLKAHTGNDKVEVEPKGKPAYDAYNSATMLFGANEPPAFVEQSDAVKDRLYHVELPYRFVSDPDPDDPAQKQAKSRSELLDELTSDGALAAVLYRMVEGARRIQVHGDFSDDRTPDERMESYEEEADPIASLARFAFENDPSAAVALDDIKTLYDKLAPQRGWPQKDKKTIGKGLGRLTSLTFSTGHYLRSWGSEDGDRPHVYKGIRFTGDAVDTLGEDTTHADRYREQLGLTDESGDDESSDPVTPLNELEPGRFDLRGTIDNVRDEPVPWLDDQGVVRDETDSYRYEIVESREFADAGEGAEVLVKDAIVTSDEADLKIQVVAGLTEVLVIDTGDRDDDQRRVDETPANPEELEPESSEGDEAVPVPEDALETVTDEIEGVSDKTGDWEITTVEIEGPGKLDMWYVDHRDVAHDRERGPYKVHAHENGWTWMYVGEMEMFSRAEDRLDELVPVEEHIEQTETPEAPPQSQRKTSIYHRVRKVDESQEDEGADVSTVVAIEAGNLCLHPSTVQRDIESMIESGRLTEVAEGRVMQS
ncbi:DNA primase family protein [Natrialbaceae archaeon AArc-T1-2]|uniref:DNA primase family protein n=1 Tax=Natrialbaceae archaeon AArc-T1-2 TaxID=3053904 RepID=UPI00255AEC54|nr:phage/plasmid primase, P4 family [Natrialbaceae archaeon AArc-T1-2]WIV66556.1 phage/plasmid primase, P4 family [Natrialbaceae archaeon AArc-T1-2]